MAAAEPVPEPVGLQLGTRGRETADVTEGQVEAQPCRAYFGQSSNLHFSVRAEITGGIPVASDSLDSGKELDTTEGTSVSTYARTHARIPSLDVTAGPRVSHPLSAALSHHSTASNNEELIRSFNCVWKLGGLGAV